MITVYATTDEGNGYTTIIGKYESIEDCEIRLSFYANDVVITFVEEKESTDDNPQG